MARSARSLSGQVATLSLPVLLIVFSGCLRSSDQEAPAHFGASLTSGGPAEVSGFESFRLHGFAGALRILPRAYSDEFTSLEGRILNATIYRVELSHVSVPNPLLPFATSGLPNRSVVARGDLDLLLSRADAEAALAVMARNFEGSPESAPALKVSGIGRNPRLSTMFDSRDTYGVNPGPNESAEIVQDGVYLVSGPSTFGGVASGALRLYWFQSTISFSQANRSLELQSRVWEEPTLPNQAAVQHVVWHELEADESRIVLRWPVNEALNSVVFAESMSLASAKVLSLDSAETIQGGLPPNTEAVGPSLWVRGNMNLDFEVQDAARSQASSMYRIQTSGKLESYSTGGGAPIQINPAVATASLAVLLAGFLIAARGLVAEFLGRLGFGGFSRLHQSRLLDHPTRKDLYETIRANPAISFLELRQRVPDSVTGRPFAVGTLQHHLARLETFKLIASQLVGPSRRYFDAQDGKKMENAARALLLNPVARVLAETVKANPGLDMRGIRKAAGARLQVSRQTVHYHLARLQDEDLLVSKKEGYFRAYRPSAALLQALASLDRVPSAGAPSGADVGASA